MARAAAPRRLEQLPNPCSFPPSLSPPPWQELRGDTWWVVAASTGVLQDCLREVSAWDPASLPPMASAEAVKRRCWEGVLLEANVDFWAAL